MPEGCSADDPRANLLLDLDADDERTWVGRQVRIGTAVLEVTRTPKHCLGVYAEVRTPGELRVGDDVLLYVRPVRTAGGTPAVAAARGLQRRRRGPAAARRHGAARELHAGRDRGRARPPGPRATEGALQDDGTYDFSGVLAPVASLIGAADLAICHLETPVAPRGGPYRGYPSFAVQPEIVDALAGAGFDDCSTASNHSLDDGTDGLVRTLVALDAAGIGHAGTYRTQAESTTPRIWTRTG